MQYAARRPQVDRRTALALGGLALDLYADGECHYMPSPMVVGIFDFTMMRTGSDLNTQELARLFHHYMSGDRAFMATNFDDDKQVSIMRSLLHEEALREGEYLEVLDYGIPALVVLSGSGV